MLAFDLMGALHSRSRPSVQAEAAEVRVILCNDEATQQGLSVARERPTDAVVATDLAAAVLLIPDVLTHVLRVVGSPWCAANRASPLVCSAWRGAIEVLKSEHVLTLAGTLGAGWGGGAHQMRDPTAVAALPDGDVLVSDFGNHRISRFAHAAGGSWRVASVYGGVAPSDPAVAHFDLREPLLYPTGLAADAEHVYVADLTNVVRKVRLVDGAIVATSRAPLHCPFGLALCDDSLLVADSANDRVVRASSFLGL